MFVCVFQINVINAESEYPNQCRNMQHEVKNKLFELMMVVNMYSNLGKLMSKRGNKNLDTM